MSNLRSTPARRPDPRLRIITEALRQPVPNVAPADLITGSNISRFDDNVAHAPAPWAMQVDMLANRIYTALFGRPGEETSPLEQAEVAKRRRDLGGEVAALMLGQRALEQAPWYPARPGDVMHVHYEATGLLPECGETYVVEHSDAEGGLILRLVHYSPEMAYPGGCFAPGLVDDPLMEAWIEVGPHRLTLVRDGRVVHAGSRT
ncbi:hypothetical protein [Microtetraspora niveoalba]|uniref:hypothetical protein n=1 Tax=Microtetraspora niveoalba TaxID=46175 RepID=UPI00083659AB|nr:hypothetical protein [Microtetraspora niveoalba]